MAVEEVDLRSQHVCEARSAFVDVVVTTTAAEQFGPWCSASDVEGGRDGRNGVCLGDNEQKGDAHGGCASYWSTPAEAEQRPRGHPVVPYRPILWGHKLLPEWAVGSSADGQVPGHSVTRDVDRLSTEQRAKTVEQSQCEIRLPFLSVDIIAAAKPSVSGDWAIAAASRVSETASSTMCMPAKDVPHAMI